MIEMKRHCYGVIVIAASLLAGYSDADASADQSPEEQFAAFKSFYLNRDDGTLGVPTSDAGREALLSLERAAYAGHAEAQLHLGHMLTSGTILPKDRESGTYWLLLSAQQDNLEAQLLVAGEFFRQAYEQEDHDESQILRANSRRWYKKAGDNGSVLGQRMYAQSLAGDTETRFEGVRLLGDLAVAGDQESKESLLVIRETVEEAERLVAAGELDYENSRESDLNDIRELADYIEEQLDRSDHSQAKSKQ